MSENYIQKASEEKGDSSEEEMGVGEFLSHAQNNPNSIADSVNYLLAAIEHFGTREVFEDGKERERYCFFDDPYGNGEHAILGNTKLLNSFVDELRRRASEEGDNNKIIWFVGPTATGKSELKRCIINGLRGFAETEEGARYTLEWTLQESSASGARMSYGEGSSITKDYYKSPVNTNPLSLLPEDTREKFISDLDKNIEINEELDPFSQEALDIIEDNTESFEEIVESEFVRAKRYYPEVGDGIGVLHSEDNGNPKQKLVGSWMQGAMEKFAKRGEKNPQAFAYDGVLSQGNSLVSIVEDASHHSDVLDKMLNVCEEDMVKLDNKISMELDTLIFVFSNPDLEAQLEQHSDIGNQDPMKALRRRLDKYEFEYLTTLSIEALLIKRHLKDESFIWDGDEDRMDKVIEPMNLYGCEISPRTIQAAASYEIATRLTDSQVPLNTAEEIVMLEEGEIEHKGEIYGLDNFTEYSYGNGKTGIPVTYTVDTIVQLSQSEDFILPDDIIDEMANNTSEEPVFSEVESDHFVDLMGDVKEYIFDKQQDDVLEAMVGDVEVTEEDVREYVDSLLAWQDGESEEFDAYEMKEFETRYLGQDSSQYDMSNDAMPSPIIQEFRKEIISPINKFMWEQRDEDFEVDDVPLSESPSLEPLIEENDWDTVNRIYPDIDISQWENPPEDTQTQELKEKTVNNMIEKMDYSQESAEAVSKKVVENRAGIEEV